MILLKNIIKTGRILKDKYNNEYEIVLFNGRNSLLNIKKKRNSTINLIYNKNFDLDCDELNNIELSNYENQQWDILEQFII